MIGLTPKHVDFNCLILIDEEGKEYALSLVSLLAAGYTHYTHATGRKTDELRAPRKGEQMSEAMRQKVIEGLKNMDPIERTRSTKMFTRIVKSKKVPSHDGTLLFWQLELECGHTEWRLATGRYENESFKRVKCNKCIKRKEELRSL
jgi:hypothetical protein